MSASDGWSRLKAFLEDLRRLNPDYPASELSRMRQLATSVGGGPFAEAGALVSEVIGLYLDSPPKRAGGAVMAEYHALLESEERRLLTAGELQMCSGARIPIPRGREGAVREAFRSWIDR